MTPLNTEDVCLDWAPLCSGTAIAFYTQGLWQGNAYMNDDLGIPLWLAGKEQKVDHDLLVDH